MEIAELIESLDKQAELYEKIDDGYGYGYDRDAANIRRAIAIIKRFEGEWDRLKTSLCIRCDCLDYRNLDKLAMVTTLKSNIIHDMREIGKNVFGEEKYGCEEQAHEN